MNTKGFTLVELLAVIIILALLTLLASTSVTKLVKDSKEELSSTQIELIKSAAEMWGAENIDKLPSSGQCTYITLGDLKEYGFLDSSIVDATNNQEISNDLKIKIVGTKSEYGKLLLKYETNPENIDGCNRIYSNGQPVYFNVSIGEACTNYTESQSATGVKTGCMKFYAFNDSVENDTINLLLDHNTTAVVEWNSNGSNANAPTTLLSKLASDTGSWMGTETPINYSVDQSDAVSKANYTVDYSTYNARLITAEEIAQITGNTSWDLITKYYFDSLTSTSSPTCKSGDTSGCEYGWLYDRTDKNCTNYGCLNNSDVSTYGYWTASSPWYVSLSGILDSNNVSADNSFGVRPVITVLKSKIS